MTELDKYYLVRHVKDHKLVYHPNTDDWRDATKFYTLSGAKMAAETVTGDIYVVETQMRQMRYI